MRTFIKTDYGRGLLLSYIIEGKNNNNECLYGAFEDLNVALQRKSFIIYLLSLKTHLRKKKKSPLQEWPGQKGSNNLPGHKAQSFKSTFNSFGEGSMDNFKIFCRLFQATDLSKSFF